MSHTCSGECHECKRQRVVDAIYLAYVYSLSPAELLQEAEALIRKRKSGCEG